MRKSVIKEVMSHLGKSKSDAKVAAAQRNGRMPCAPGKKRGRPAKTEAMPA